MSLPLAAAAPAKCSGGLTRGDIFVCGGEGWDGGEEGSRRETVERWGGEGRRRKVEGEWNGGSKEKDRGKEREGVCVCAVADGVDTITRNSTQ